MSIYSFNTASMADKNYDDNRYRWMWSTDMKGYFFDTETLRFDKNSKTIDVWIKIVYSPEAVQAFLDKAPSEYLKNKFSDLHYQLSHYQFDVSSKQIRHGETAWYANDGSLIYYNHSNLGSWETIIPGSNAEHWEKHILSYMVSKLEKHSINQ